MSVTVTQSSVCSILVTGQLSFTLFLSSLAILSDICWEPPSIFFSYNTINTFSLYGQRHVKRDLQTYAKSVDPDQPPRLWRRVWSGSALFDRPHIKGTKSFNSCYVNNFIRNRCFRHCNGADLGLHDVKCQKVPCCTTQVNQSIISNLILRSKARFLAHRLRN